MLALPNVAPGSPVRLGPYLLTEIIGQGGMAIVYKAKRLGPSGFEKTVVVKAMLPNMTGQREFVSMFTEEAKLTAQLAHPNIVQVHDFGVIDGLPYLVMEYLNGRNLTQLRQALQAEGKRLPLGVALLIAREMCHALGHAHEFVDAAGVRRQIIHRDVSPSNIMLCRDGSVKLLDFGVAKMAGEFDSDVTQSFKGKFAYMAPEQVKHEPIDRRIDVFAAGIVLHEMLTGKRLFAADSELETLQRVSAAQVVAPSIDNPEVPPELDRLVKKALARDPSQRFQSGAEMAEALEELSAKAMTRKRAAGWLSDLFPGVWTITCECCGKQVTPATKCLECGEEAPASTSGSNSRPIAISRDADPLPPPPVGARVHGLGRPRLRVVTPLPPPVIKAAVAQAAMGKEIEDEDANTGFFANDKTEIDDTELKTDPPPPAQRLFAVPQQENTVMGRKDPTPAPVVTAPIVAEPVFVPPAINTVNTAPILVPVSQVDLRQKSGKLSWIIGGIVIAIGLSAAALVIPATTQSAPVVVAPVVAAPVAPAPVPKPVVVEAPKPVAVEAPKPVVVEAPKPVVVEAPKPVVVEAPKPKAKPAPVASAPKKKPNRTSAPARPRTESRAAVKEGGIVDPFGN